MITGLVNPQTIRTAEMLDVRVIIFVRGKVPDETMQKLAEEKGIDIIARIPRSDDITRCEDVGKTCVEGAPESDAAVEFVKLAKKLLDEEGSK